VPPARSAGPVPDADTSGTERRLRAYRSGHTPSGPAVKATSAAWAAISTPSIRPTCTPCS